MSRPVVCLPFAATILLCATACTTTSTTSAPLVTTTTPAPPAPPTVDDAVARLIAAAVFEDQAISIDGHVSPGVEAFRVIDAADDAAARFAEVAVRGGTVGKLYAAIGLRAHDVVGSDATIASLRSDGEERVATRFGCLGGSETVNALVEHPGADAIRLAEGQTVADWLHLHGTGAIDIVGGGYSDLFRR